MQLVKIDLSCFLFLSLSGIKAFVSSSESFRPKGIAMFGNVLECHMALGWENKWMLIGLVTVRSLLWCICTGLPALAQLGLSCFSRAKTGRGYRLVKLLNFINCVYPLHLLLYFWEYSYSKQIIEHT